MKQIELNSGKYLLLEVPEDSDTSFITDPKFIHLRYGNGRKKAIGLPPGQWSIIGKADELKEDDWKGIVETVQMPNEPIYYKGYGVVDYVATTNVIESGLSLIASHNMQPSQTLILKLN